MELTREQIQFVLDNCKYKLDVAVEIGKGNVSIPEIMVIPDKIEKKKLVRPRVKEGSEYFYFCSGGEIFRTCDNKDLCDNNRYYNGNYFLTEQEAIDSHRYEKEIIRQKVQDIADRIGKVTYEMLENIKINKYFLYFDNSEEEWILDFDIVSYIPNVIYCLRGPEFHDAVLSELTLEELELWKRM